MAGKEIENDEDKKDVSDIEGPKVRQESSERPSPLRDIYFEEAVVRCN